ncbi:MAG: MotA/TolQ/ExbB proton channel family protein [Alphaproteobacteria bacterium]
MTWVTSGFDLLERGGSVMYVLLALSILALAVALLKLLHFSQARLRRLGFIDTVVAQLGRGDVGGARQILTGEVNPVARVLDSAIATGVDRAMADRDRDAEIARVGSGEIRKLESFLGSLEVVANLSPLLGLLGTVFGMIAAFSQLEKAGAEVDPTILAGGIWEALLTTAFGLSIAIPALAAFYFLEGEVERVRVAMKDSVVRVNTVLGRSRGRGAAS